MKTSWRKKLLYAVLILALAVQSAPIAFAADTDPQIWYMEGGCANEDGTWVPEYWVDADGNRKQETPPQKRLRSAANLPRQYNLCDYGQVTSVKNQAGAENCWAFSAVASLESSYIRQGFGTAENTDFSEAHLVWFSLHQRTPDPTDPTYGDGMEVEKPFLTAGNWSMAASALLRGSGLQLEQNAPWITTYDHSLLMQMAQPESDRYVSYARMWNVQSIGDSREAIKQKLLENGAVNLSYYDDYSDYQKGKISKSGYSSDKSCYYQTAHTETNHTVTVVGWDDDFPRGCFRVDQQPTADGAWLIKGSWGATWGDHGYYWISYEDPSLNQFVSYSAAPADIYDHIYQYDGSYPKTHLTVSGSGKFANVFTAERDELLTHAAFFSYNQTPVKATVEVYVAPENFNYNQTNPVSGMTKVDAATTVETGIAYGYYTVELNTPVLLQEGRMFTVVVTLEGTTVNIPVEGYAVENPADGVQTFAGNVGESFFGYRNAWYDTNAYNHTSCLLDLNNVPLKAMTCDLPSENPSLTVLKSPEKTTYLVGETLDMTGLTLLYTDENGNDSVVTSGFPTEVPTFNESGAQTVTMTYGGLSASFDVKVIQNEPTLSLVSQPQTTTYMVGDTIDTTGLSLLYTDEYGTQHTVTDGFVYSPHTLRSIGTKTVDVTYQDLTVSFDVTSEPYEPMLTLQSAPSTTTYYINETLDTAGLSLLYTNEYNKTSVVTQGFTCSPRTFSADGTQTVTATYKDLSVTFDVTVEMYEPTLTVLTEPDKTTYLVGEAIDTTGLSLVYMNEYGDEVTVTGGFTCEPQVFTEIGPQTATVTYNDVSASFDVTVEPHETTLTLQAAPDKTTYKVGEALDTTGLTLVYTDEYGDAFVVTEGYVCDAGTFREAGTQTVTVGYNNLSVTFDVTVELYEPTLTLQAAPDKTTYMVGEALDTTGLTLVYTNEYGDALVVTEGYACDAATFAEAGTQTVTVSYNNLSVTFDVTVESVGTFLVSDASAHAGETVDVAVRISGNTGIVSAWLELDYDADVLELTHVRNGDVFADTCFTPSGKLTAVPFRVLFIDALANENNTQNGDLVVFTFRVRTDAPAGETAVSLRYEESSTLDKDLQSVPFLTQSGTFTVERLPGDVNADGVIDLKDVVMLRRYLANWDVTINLANADVDMESDVDVRDVVYITRFLAGGYGLTLH